jgi:(2Fe-2S) ferredoxin
MPDPYYQRHIFFCLNDREKSEKSCADNGAADAYEHCKSRVKKEGLSEPGQVRVNKAGCMNRCAGGPVAVVYPEGVWYSYVDSSDIDEIVDSHLKRGEVVTRLLLAPEVGR